LGKRENVEDPNNKGQVGVYLHPKPPCDNGIVSPLFIEAIIEVPLETRFACNFLMIARMHEVKDALEKMVIDPRWNEYVSTLFNR
jgi:hypothetical protein